LMETGKSSHI